jgi:tRNA(adenine34) deaminase
MDEFFMREALKEAKLAMELDEVPVGAVIVHEGKIIAKAHNLVEKLKDASAHAEMLCIKQASLLLDNWRLKETTLYCTLEPCAMCAGAMLLSRVHTLVWGAPDLRHGAHGSWTNLLDAKHPMHAVNVRTKILEDESAALLKEFFQKKRK